MRVALGLIVVSDLVSLCLRFTTLTPVTRGDVATALKGSAQIITGSVTLSGQKHMYVSRVVMDPGSVLRCV